jgi:hypothetical protein
MAFFLTSLICDCCLKWFANYSEVDKDYYAWLQTTIIFYARGSLSD